MRVTTGMIARYLPDLLGASSEETSSNSSMVAAAGAQVAARKSMTANDANRDNVLTQDEVTISEEAFQKLDADKNNEVTRKEIEAYLRENPEAVAGYVKNYASMAKDSNILDEVMGYVEDTDSGSTAQSAAKKYIKNNDEDGDGKLSRNETGLDAEVFDKVDEDGDDALSAEEIAAYLKNYENVLSSYLDSGSSSSTSTAATSLLSMLTKTV